MDSSLSVESSKTQRVYDFIDGEIRAGILAPGTRMQGMRDLARKFDVSVAVINSAYNTLEEKGMIVRKARSGIIINPNVALSQTKLIALITGYGRDDIEGYYEPLLAVSGEKRVVNILGALNFKLNWKQTIRDIISRQPDGLLIDVEARTFPLEELKPLISSIPTCYCNRWEWRPEKPDRAVLTDFAWAYSKALRLLSENGHERIAIMTFHQQTLPFLLEYLNLAKLQAGFTENDRRLLIFSRDALLADTATVNRQLKKFQPTAVFAVSDYLLDVLNKKFPGAAKMEKIGFFDQKYSQASNGNFTSFRIDFSKIWETAISSYYDNSQKVTYVKPELVRRGIIATDVH